MRKVLFTGPAEVLLADGTVLKVNFTNKTVIQIQKNYGRVEERSLGVLWPEGNLLLSPCVFRKNTGPFYWVTTQTDYVSDWDPDDPFKMKKIQ